ncbi:hypothetical protein [Citrobacter portucalensis]|uniref:hypothetical protein n=1 Tax=Citrobacter portucalensis TaxID=1639133 RepID=UPI003BF479B6
MTRLLLCILLFVCNSSYSREKPEYSKTYTPDEYYYLSSKIPKEVRQVSLYTDYCIIYLSFSLTKDSGMDDTGENIHKYCANLDTWNSKLKKKYTNNHEVLLMLTMTDDAISLYHDYEDKIVK